MALSLFPKLQSKYRSIPILSPRDTILSTQHKPKTAAKMVHSKRDEKAWEDISLEPIAIVGMGKCLLTLAESGRSHME